MTIDAENTSPDNLARVANAAKEAGIADESAAYEVAAEASRVATDPAPSQPGDNAETDEIEAHPS